MANPVAIKGLTGNAAASTSGFASKWPISLKHASADPQQTVKEDYDEHTKTRKIQERRPPAGHDQNTRAA